MASGGKGWYHSRVLVAPAVCPLPWPGLDLWPGLRFGEPGDRLGELGVLIVLDVPAAVLLARPSRPEGF